MGVGHPRRTLVLSSASSGAPLRARLNHHPENETNQEHRRMMEVIQSLIDCDPVIVCHLQKARVFWTNFFADKTDWSKQQFTDWFNIYQVSFNAAIDAENVLAKEIFALTCLKALLGKDVVPNRALASRVMKAMLVSSMSWEVKYYACSAIKIYQLPCDEELKAAIRNFC
jgi:hypothetical protein